MTSAGFQSGYTCTFCRAFVPWGVSHSCNQAPQVPTSYTPPGQDRPVELRIAAALERIANALEVLTRDSATAEATE